MAKVNDQETEEFRRKMFDEILKPLIEDNYEKRRLGLIPDEWFWADFIAISWGFYVDPIPGFVPVPPKNKINKPNLTLVDNISVIVEPKYGAKKPLSLRTFPTGNNPRN